MSHKILIVGGGFGGVRAALDLAGKRLPGVSVTLLTDKPYLEYYGALYRVVSGHAPWGVCIPLKDIVHGKNVEVVVDAVQMADLSSKEVTGASGKRYGFDTLLLAAGSATAYFNIPGMEEMSFSVKSTEEALALKRHIHEVFRRVKAATSNDERVPGAHIIVIGAGATGVEVAAELAVYGRGLAKEYGFPPSLVTVDIIEAMDRVAPMLPPDMSAKVEARLRKLGVNVFLNRSVTQAVEGQVILKDSDMKSQTVIWTAGVKAHRLAASVQGLALDRKGRVEVDESLQAKGAPGVYVLGDAAATPYSGMAQTAVYDGGFVAKVIASRLGRGAMPTYKPSKPSVALPVGPAWAAVHYMGMKFYGRVGWWLRRAADMKVYLMFLTPWQAWQVWRGKAGLSGCCDIVFKK